jgi:hypothetical protein
MEANIERQYPYRFGWGGHLFIFIILEAFSGLSSFSPSATPAI